MKIVPSYSGTNSVAKFCTRLGGVVSLACLVAISVVAQEPSTSTSERAKDRALDMNDRIGDQHDSLVSVNFVATPILDALNEVSRQSGIPINYVKETLPSNARVTLRAKRMKAIDVIAALLNGTGLRVGPGLPGSLKLVAKDTTVAVQTDNGNEIIKGVVVDSSTGTGIPRAVIVLNPGNYTTLSNDKGIYSLRVKNPGKYVVSVKAFGFKSVSRNLIVTKGSYVNFSFALVAVSTQLSGVVTTATGEQRKIEVGNDITTVRADSIIRTMPVQNLSDLLATRVPGLYAAPTSGNPGAPTRIRIRGLSSVGESNDPIIIVDGIRVASDQMRNANNLVAPGLGYLVSSPLDMIDVNSIETVEVLKGPSAVALYGSDAANGVIAIKTKRGQAGPPRVNMSAQFGTTTIPGKWPVNYYMWGHNATDPLTAVGCRLEWQAQGICTADSLITYQILNDPKRSVLGRGTTQTYRGEVSGSNRGMMYSLSGSINGTIGVVKLPEIDRALLVRAGQSVPSWLRRPESDMKKSGALNLSMDMGRYSVVSFRSQLMHSATDASPLRNALTWTRSALPPVDSGSSGLLAGIPGYRTRIRSQSLKSTNSLDVLSTFGSRLVTQLTSGTDVTNRTDLATLGTGECFVASSSCLNDGIYNTGQGSDMVTTMNIRATSPLQLRNFASLRSTIGVNYNRTSSRNLVVSAEGLPTGATSGANAARFRQSQAHNDRITAGMYIETVVGIANRWYFPLAIRKDAGSALGSQIMPKFPKLGVSYVLSDDRWFQAIPGAAAISMLRIRAAYGQAGVQPGVSKKDRNYMQSSVSLNGIATSYLSVWNIGNSQLRPERSKEYEGGFDFDVFNDRISTSVTLYRKNTVDLLTDMGTPQSIGGNGFQQANAGDVINTGIEISLNAVPVDHSVVRLSNSVQFTLNRNRLTRLGSLQTGQAGFAVGYPLNGYWARPIVGVFDLNHDGMVSATEYVLGDSAMYLGAPQPRYSINSNHTMTILRHLNVTGVIQYENGLTQQRSEAKSTIRAYFDPQTPLELQAITQYSDLHKIQTVSVLRFDALSIGYDMPKRLTSRFLRNRVMRVAVQARNVGLWTNYRGLDPKVNSDMTESNVDNGVVPQPKIWQLSFGIN